MFKRYKVMKRIVILFDYKHKEIVRAHLVNYRLQYSMSTDVYSGEVRLSVPYSKGVRFLAELRRSSIPYELI